MKMVSSKTVNFMDHKAFKINSSVVDYGFCLPLRSPADPYFLHGDTKQKTRIFIAQLQKFRIIKD